MRLPAPAAGRLLPALLLALLLQPCVGSAAAAAADPQTTLTFHISASPHLPPSTHATLSTLRRRPAVAADWSLPSAARLTPADTLVFRNVTAGSYLLDVHCTTHAFAPLRVDVGAGAAHGDDGEGEGDDDGAAAGALVGAAWEIFRGGDWNNRGVAVPILDLDSGGPAAFEIRAVAAKNPFTERPRFSVLSVFYNPMIIMAIVTLGLFMGMPYLVARMDPEMRAEFEETSRSNPLLGITGGKAGSGGYDLAGMLAGSNGGAGAGEDEPVKKKTKGAKR